MDYFRAGGVCLLIMLIAAALPIGGLAATQTGAANSGFNSVNPSASGATPVVNANSFSNGIGAQEFGQAAASIKVQRPSSGIRPGAVTGSYVPVAAATTETTTNSETSNTVPQGQSTPTSPSTQAVTTTAANAEQSTATPAPATTPETLKTSTITSAPTEPTPSSNPTANNNVALPSSNVAAVGNETPTIAAVNSTVTNPTIVDENKSTASISTSNNTTPSVTAVSENNPGQNITPAEISPAVTPALTDRIWRQGISSLDYTWTPLIFSGFFYDMDDKVGTENLTVHLTSETSRSIAEHNLKYDTNVQPVDFKFKDWGKYQVIGFMADKYFAGYNNQTAFADEASVISEGQLRKVLLDSDDSQTIASGSVLPLQEGYELRIKEVDLNGNKVFLALAKDGKEIDSKVVTPSGEAKDRASNYMYKVDMGSEKNVPMIIAHVQSVFTSTESNLATVDAVFQVSDSPESVEEGEVHGKMKVETLDSDGITMNNADSAISLSRGRVVDIMENLRLEVADNAKRLTAPIATKTGEGSTIALTVPVAVVNRPIALSTKSGSQSLTGVQISVNGSSIGTTDITGSISYTPDSTGTFSVIARKSGYLDGTASMTVTTASEASTLAAIQEANKTLSYRLTLNAPAEVVKGENFLITVVEGINQTPVDKALISLDEENIGDTSAEGTLTYSANATGEHTLKAEKEGFNSTTRKITVTSSLKVVNLTVPDVGYVSQAMKISAIVQNVGNVNDSRMLELKVNDTVADSKNVTVDPGKNITVNFSYTPMDPGLCRFSVDDITRTVNVEKAQNSNWLIALILVLLIAGGVGYYLHTTGELDKLQKQVKKMMQGR